MASLSGKTLGKYQVGDRIGRGGMAEVYRGFHARLARESAIKVLYSHLAEGKDFLVRFEREARAVASLRHPNIVQVFDFDVEDETIYMVMDFIDGGSLMALLVDQAERATFLPLDEVARILRQIASALDHAHRTGLLHRDLKPSNILLDGEGNAYLTDFGIARIMSDNQFTATGTLIGTPAYMSPEQGRGEALTTASDIYSLGVILYEMLAGAPPYNADTPLAIIHKHIHEPLPSLCQVRPELPAAVEAVVNKALAKAPEDRYPNARDLSIELDAALALLAEKQSPSREPALAAGPGSTSVVDPETEQLPPTVVMEEEERIATVAMEPEVSEVQDDSAAPASLEAGAAPVAGAPVAQPATQRASRPASERKWLPWIGGGILLAIVVAVVLALSGVFQSDGEVGICTSVDECMMQAHELLEAGEIDVAIDRFNHTAEMVPDEDRFLKAEVYCSAGHAFVGMDLREEALRSFEACIHWAGELPETEGLRLQAEEMLNELWGE